MATIGRTNSYARPLRREGTDAERRLWHHLRNRKLAALKFRRQVTIGRCIADFACVDCKLIVEADGGQHSHEADAARTAYLENLGWKLLTFWNNQILQQTEEVLQVILTACEEKRNSKPSPNPLPPAGEG